MTPPHLLCCLPSPKWSLSVCLIQSPVHGSLQESLHSSLHLGMAREKGRPCPSSLHVQRAPGESLLVMRLCGNGQNPAHFVPFTLSLGKHSPLLVKKELFRSA